jgi:WD40 repeat protein
MVKGNVALNGRAEARVFISYARRDGEMYATNLHRRLEREQPEITIWQDRSRMEGGVGWWKQITAALEKVHYLVLVMTPAAIVSEESRREWRYARQAGVCVYPVKGVPDAELNFDAMPLWMRKAHFFDLDREWETFVQYLKSPCQADRVPFMAADLPPGFVQRPVLIRRVLDLILDSGSPHPGIVVLHGAGGLGKTTLAASVCHHEDVTTGFPDGILWATLGEKPDLVERLTEIYAALTGERPKFVSEEDAANEVARRLENRHLLLVIDDVWSSRHLRSFLRGGVGCVRLITTRQFEIAVEFAGAQARMRIPQMEREEALEMLLGRVDQPPAEVLPLGALATRLGDWPLMLKLARGALEQRLARGDSLSGALRHLNLALDRKGFTVFDSDDAADRRAGLGRTIQVSLDLLEPSDQNRAFELSVFPEDLDIPLPGAADLWELDAFESEQLAERLDGLSLLEFDVKRAVLRLHDLMRGYFRGRLADAASVHRRLIQTWGDPRTVRDAYAFRWYLYHLAGAGQNNEVKRLLTDFDLVQDRLSRIGINSLLADYEYSRNSEELRRLQAAIRLSAHAVTVDPTQFATQLLGRLSPQSEAELTLLAGAARYHSRPWLAPVCPSLTQPGGPILRLLTGHEGPIRCVAVSRDGRRIVSGSSVKNEAIVWDVATWSVLCRLQGHASAVNAVAISNDGRLVVSGSDDQTAKVWNADTGELMLTLSGHTGAVRAVALSGLADRAVTGSFDKSVVLWDLSTGRALRTGSGDDWIRAIAMTEEGDQIVFTSMDSTVRVWNIASGSDQAIAVLQFHHQPARTLALCSEKRLALTGSDDGCLIAWKTDGSVVRMLRESGATIESCSVDAQGKRAISVSLNDEACIWDLENGRLLRSFQSAAGNLNAVAISPGGEWAVTGSHDETLRVWDIRSEGAAAGVHGHSGWVTGVAIVSEGQFGVSGAQDGTLKIWDTATGREVRSIKVEGGAVRSVATARGRIVSGSERGMLRVWDAGSGILLLETLTGSAVNAVAIDGSATRAVSGSPDGVLRVWDLASLRPVQVIRAHHTSIMALCLNTEGTIAATASADRTVKVWELNSGRELHNLSGHKDFVRCVSISADGARAMSYSRPGPILVWDLASGSVLMKITEEIGTVNSAAMISNGQRAVTGSGDHTVRLWDLDRARCVASFTADDTVTGCAVSADAGTIIAGDASGAVHILQVRAVAGSLELTNKT